MVAEDEHSDEVCGSGSGLHSYGVEGRRRARAGDMPPLRNSRSSILSSYVSMVDYNDDGDKISGGELKAMAGRPFRARA